MSLKEKVVGLSQFSASKIRPSQNLEIALLLDRQKGITLQDICTIDYTQTGIQSPSEYFYDSLKFAFNPVLAESRYISISTGETYCAKTARKAYRVVRMTKEEFDVISSFESINSYLSNMSKKL